MVVPDCPRHLGIIFQPCAALNNLIIYTDIRSNWQLQLSGMQIFFCNLRLVQTGRSLHIEMSRHILYVRNLRIPILCACDPITHIHNYLFKMIDTAPLLKKIFYGHNSALLSNCILP